MNKGYIALVLHAHLPYVHHPEMDGMIEERWIFEAISETYIPLLKVFEKLESEGIGFKLTMSFSPTLLAMLSTPLLQQRYIKYLKKLLELCEKEIVRTKDQEEFNKLARMYYDKYSNDLYTFETKYNCNIIEEYKKLQLSGKLEIMTCAATHGFLPLMAINRQALYAQITVGAREYARYFGCSARGIWLPECGYIPEVEEILRDNGIEYFITETHGLLYANPKPVFGTYSPIVTEKGLVAFGRDSESSRQVWSATEGYPGDHDYREYYRDIGHDLDYSYIRDYISKDGSRINTGVKYYRITGENKEKQPYNPAWAANKADIHAGNFILSREKQILHLFEKLDKPPVIVCPYDAELFGHWWYEGPQWLYSFIKKAQDQDSKLQLITPGEYIRKYPVMQVSNPCPSSWGHMGYNEVWLNEANDWIYKHLHRAADMMTELANNYYGAEGIIIRALNQAARELLLAQSSDWAFIMKMGTMVQYAEKRTKDHMERFNRLYHDIKENCIDENWLVGICAMDNLFPEMDYRIYSNKIILDAI